MAHDEVTLRLRFFGIVQGVGFRPTICRHALETKVRGTVCNKGPYVEVFCQGTPQAVDRFVERAQAEPPKRSIIIRLEVQKVTDAPVFEDFRIVESRRTKGAIFVSPDIAICDECARELFDPTNRRYLHPFINCTNCGPRLTILDRLPYDRQRTSMGAFPMCEACAAEYTDPASRRFDAQPVCCCDCGPEVYLIDRTERGRDAITYARRVVAGGGIIAVKGIGGFHLACDATNEEAVRLLRQRKRRSNKPFAVMAKDIDVAEREVCLTPEARELLLGHQRPIVLLERRAEGLCAPSVAPDNPKLGIMVPYAPVQMLLFDYPDGISMPDLLVMTSANESGAPIARDDDDARRELVGLADAVLSNDRLIRVRADDTVVDLVCGHPCMVRRSRGFAPLPQPLPSPLSLDVLAIGGELKNVFCVGTSELCYLSPYVGDLADVRTVEALGETCERMLDLLEVRPALVACDLHPGYNSRAVARAFADGRGLRLVGVQHHFAHVVSCLAENEREQRVIGVALDGTGYGEDGTIWGGELLLADTCSYERAAHIAPFPQPGGDASAREGWRVALGMLHHATQDREKTIGMARALGLAEEQEAKVICAMVERSLNCVTSTSAGRLFDAVSAVLGIARTSSFEGEAACALQFAAQDHIKAYGETECAQLIQEALARTCAADTIRIATDVLFEHIVRARLAGTDASELAWAFHAGLAQLVIRASELVRERTGIGVAALTGGCFQNTLLLGLVRRGLEERGFEVLTHSLVPPNDGGIALGQAVAAVRMVERELVEASKTDTDESE